MKIAILKMMMLQQEACGGAISLPHCIVAENVVKEMQTERCADAHTNQVLVTVAAHVRRRLIMVLCEVNIGTYR